MKKEILLAYFPKLTYHRFKILKNTFSNLDEAWNADRNELSKTGWDNNFIHEFICWRDEIDEKKIKKILAQEKIHCVLREDSEYPPLLKQIYDPPICLFVRGNLKNLYFPLAVVGPRKFSPYGEQIAHELVRDLSRAGITIISGLALGIDAIAHRETLERSGRTVAVLGSGCDRQHIYPAAHRNLAEKIIESGGAVVSEYPPGALASKYTFPRRNRIVAGISHGVLVVEAGDKSGSLITAACALDNGREVFAVPQNITSPTSIGVNNLLTMGANPVTSSNDILDALNLQKLSQYVKNKRVKGDSPDEDLIISKLSREAIHIDQLAKNTGLNSAKTSSLLALMEMKGKVKNLGGMNYVIAR